MSCKGHVRAEIECYVLRSNTNPRSGHLELCVVSQPHHGYHELDRIAHMLVRHFKSHLQYYIYRRIKPGVSYRASELLCIYVSTRQQ